MNNNIKNIFRTGVMIATGVVALASCSDTWKDHYDDGLGASGISYQGSTMSYIQSKPELSNFAQVLQLTGFDARLSGDQKLTVWAPVNGSFNMDSLVREISVNKDNVLKTFVQNHVALYTISVGDRDYRTHMLNTKSYAVPAFADSINGAKMIEKNISCSNGVAHVVETPLIYRNNLYEQVEAEYMEWLKAGHSPEEAPNNLYAFLESKDTMILDESRSIANGVDEYGNRLYIDAWYDRFNEALDNSRASRLVNADAPIYEEDSSFVVIIPSPEAYQARFNYAKSLLKFHPKDTRSSNVDSLADEYANRFASYDLYYNNTNNAHAADSLKSTVYKRSGDDWYNHVYYRQKPNHALPEGKGVNDILAEGRYTKRVECSNGVAYVVDEYPMSIGEQFLFPLRDLYALHFDIDHTSGVGTGMAYSFNVPTDLKVVLRDSLKEVEGQEPETVQYLDTISGSTDVYERLMLTSVTANGMAQPRVSFLLDGTLSGKYKIKVVTAPIWARNGYESRTPLDELTTASSGFKSSKAIYHFEAYIFEREANGDYNKNIAAGVQLKASNVPGADRDKEAFLSHTFRLDPETGDSVVCMLDTITLGEYDFKYSYFGANEGGVLLQLFCNPTSVEDGKYSKDILIHKFILEPVIAEEKKSKGGK